MPGARLGRAALFAFGASIVGAATAAGCGGNVSSGPDVDAAAGAGGASSGAGGALAGGSAGSAGSSADGSSDASVNEADAGIVAMYGGSPPVDSGANADAKDMGGGIPTYGSPLPS